MRLLATKAGNETAFMILGSSVLPCSEGHRSFLENPEFSGTDIREENSISAALIFVVLFSLAGLSNARRKNGPPDSEPVLRLSAFILTAIVLTDD